MAAAKFVLRLSGLVVKRAGQLGVYNRIYELVFDRNWVEEELIKFRPYSIALAAWLASDCQNEHQLLRGQALQEAQAWSEGKSLSDRDYQFLAASQRKENEVLNRIVWELVSPLTLDQVSPKVVELLQLLRQASEDNSLALLDIEVGSTILILQGIQEGFNRIEALFEAAELPQLLGIPVQSIRRRTLTVVKEDLASPLPIYPTRSWRKQPRLGALLRWILFVGAAIAAGVTLLDPIFDIL